MSAARGSFPRAVVEAVDLAGKGILVKRMVPSSFTFTAWTPTGKGKAEIIRNSSNGASLKVICSNRHYRNSFKLVQPRARVNKLWLGP